MNIPGSSIETTLQDVEQLLEQGNMRAARELIENELRADGNHADLLPTLADVEFADGNVMAGRNTLAEAVEASALLSARTQPAPLTPRQPSRPRLMHQPVPVTHRRVHATVATQCIFSGRDLHHHQRH
jgi:hypothetical protein